MYKNLKMPAPELSELKEVNVDLDMTGRHYAMLTSAGKYNIPEDLALSILRDLMEEDPNKLTMAELRYVFTMVKIHSLENEYYVTVKCNTCGKSHKYSLLLSDADLHRTPEGYQIPTIMFKTDKQGAEKEYYVKPPLMNMESALYDWFLTEKGKTLEDIATDDETTFNFAWIRSCMHLVDTVTNERLIKDISQFELALSYLNANKYSMIDGFFDKCNEVDSFGVQNPDYKLPCKTKGCKGTVEFQLPFFYGLLG